MRKYPESLDLHTASNDYSGVCENLAKHLHDSDADHYLWEAMTAFEGYSFMTAKGLSFTYQVKRGRAGHTTGEIVFDRKEKSVTRSTVIRAFHNALKVQKQEGFVSGPKKLGVFGASYLFPVFLRLGVCENLPPDQIYRSSESGQQYIPGVFSVPSEEKRKRARIQNRKPLVYLQYQGRETAVDTLVDAVKAAFQEEHKSAVLTKMRLYVKPEEETAYYVINEMFYGKVSF